MEKNQTAFLLPLELKEVVDELSDEEAGILFKALYDYEVNKINPKLNKILKIVFKNFKIFLDKYDSAYEEKCLKNKKKITDYWEKKRNTDEYSSIPENTIENQCIPNKRERERENKREKENKNKKGGDIIYSKLNPIVKDPIPVLDPSLSSFSFELVSQYGEEHNISEECYTNFYNWFNENHKKWKNDQEWKSTLDEWWMKDFLNKPQDEEVKLTKLGDGVYQL